RFRASLPTNESGPDAYPAGFLPREQRYAPDGRFLEWSCAHLPKLFKCIVQGAYESGGQVFVDSRPPPRDLQVASLSVDPDVRPPEADEDTRGAVLTFTRYDVLNIEHI